MPLITQGKTNIKYILIVVVLAAIAGGGILAYQYWWVPKHETKIPEIKTQEPVKDETANWKTIYSPAGWSIRYPSDWRFCPDPTDAEISASFLPPQYLSEEGLMTIGFFQEIPPKTSIDQWFEAFSASHPQGKRISLNDLPAFQIVYPLGHWSEVLFYKVEDIYIIYNSKIFQISFEASRIVTQAEDLKNYSLYKNMLSTLQFTEGKESLNTPDKRTYRSACLGLELNYPSDWLLQTYLDESGGSDITTTKPGEWLGPEGKLPLGRAIIGFSKYKQEQSIDNLIAQKFPPGTDIIVSDSIINLDNLNGRQIIWTCKNCKAVYDELAGESLPGIEGRDIYFSTKNGSILQIELYYYKNDSKANSYINIFNQILPTVKLLD